MELRTAFKNITVTHRKVFQFEKRVPRSRFDTIQFQSLSHFRRLLNGCLYGAISLFLCQQIQQMKFIILPIFIFLTVIVLAASTRPARRPPKPEVPGQQKTPGSGQDALFVNDIVFPFIKDQLKQVFASSKTGSMEQTTIQSA